MKKILSMILATTLVFSLGMSAFAAGSVGSDLAGSASSYIQDDGIVAGTESVPAEATGTLATAAAAAATGKDATVLGYVGLKAEGGSEITVDVKLFNGALANGDSVIVLHYIDNAWVLEAECTVVDGKFSFTPASFSPFAFVKATPKAATATPAPTTPDAPAPAAPAAPKTADSNAVAVVFVALMAVTGLGYVASRKDSKN